MIFDLLENLNWLAVAVATVAWYVYSAIFYAGPVAGKAWQKAAKISMTEGYRPPPSIFIITLVAYFVTTTVIAMIAAAVGASDAVDGIALGVTLGVAFGAMTGLVSQVYEQKGSSYWLINGIGAIISWSIVGVILALWD